MSDNHRAQSQTRRQARTVTCDAESQRGDKHATSPTTDRRDTEDYLKIEEWTGPWSLFLPPRRRAGPIAVTDRD